MKILIKNGTIVNADATISADILIKDEKIISIDENIITSTDLTINASGKYIIPGGIDAHTHLDMPYGNITSRDDFLSGTIAAAYGGTTTIIDFAVQSKNQSLTNALEEWMRKAHNKAVIDYGFHMIISDVNENVLSEIKSLVYSGVTSFKLFTAYPDRLMLSDSEIFKVMQCAREYGALTLMHAENGEVIEYLIKNALAEKRTQPINHALTRPAQLEAEAVYRTIKLAELASVPIFIVHVSSADAIDIIAYQKKQNNKIFAETCPHYLLLSDDLLQRPDFEGAKYVLSPPLRKTMDQEKLWKAIADKTIDTIGTDHCPFNFEKDKKLGLNDFTKIPNGGPGIENRLQLLYNFGVLTGRISLERWVELISTNPAKIFGLFPKKGKIAIDADADIVIWNPDSESIISSATHHMNVDYNMYEGYKVKGSAEIVLSRGEIIIKDDKFTGKEGRGKFLKRKTFNFEQ